MAESVGAGQIRRVGPGESAGPLVVASGGTLVVAPGGTVTGLTVAGGGTVTDAGTIVLMAGDVVSGIDVQAGGVLDVTSGASATATLVEAGGTEIVTHYKHEAMQRELGVADGTRVMPGGTIAIRDFIEAGGYALVTGGNDLVVSEGVGRYGNYHYTQALAGDYAGMGVTVAAMPAIGGVAVTIACYCAGTLVLTDTGERPVEALAPGDRVVTASGPVRPVRWVGRRSYAGRFLRGNPALHPVRIRAGALGGGLPWRDLLVSPCHAMLIDGVLVPAGCLVDGAGIVREAGRDRVDYVHVELDSHDAILAEGAASETFLDDGSRGLFGNARTTPPAPAGGYCAPRVENGPALRAIRERLVGPVARAAG